MKKLYFTKMHGIGNDYIYFDMFNQEIADPNALSIKLSDRHTGVGGDGIILICPSDVADAKMRIFNADGSEAKMCGNGIRCVGKYLYDHKLSAKDEISVDTLSGIKQLKVAAEGGLAKSLRVDMGKAILNPKDIPVLLEGEQIIAQEIEIDGNPYKITCVSMGNPHAVIFGDDPDKLDLPVIGPKFEKSPLFPDSVNTEFVQVVAPNELKMRVWERGSGETMACGTGACAVAVAAVINGYCQKESDIIIHLRGGDLIIRYEADERVYMSGEAVEVFQGIVEVEEGI